MNKAPKRLQALMNGLMREVANDSFIDFLEAWAINEEEFQEIVEWFENQGIGI